MGHVAPNRNAYNGLVGKPEGKRPLGRCSRRWEVNIKMGDKQTRLEDFGWIYLAQGRDGQ